MKITRRMEWPFIDKFGSFEEVSGYCQLLYQTLTEESALRAVELDVPYTDGYNVFVGHEAGQSNTISLDDTEGIYNVFLGHQAGYSNTTGIKNIGVGYKPLYTNTTGYENIALGSEALYSNTTGYQNVAVGSNSSYSNTTSYKNIAMGYNALYSQTTPGGNNVAIGWEAGEDCTGSANVFIGAVAGSEATSGTENVCVGSGAGQGSDGNSTYSDNVLIGVDAGASLTTGSGNIFIGYQCAYTRETTGANKLYIANSNTATPLIGGVFPNTSLTFTSTATTFSGNIGIGATSSGGILSIGSSNDSYFSSANPNTLNFLYNTNADTGGWVNYKGYQDGTTQFRDFMVGNGKGVAMATFDGSEGTLAVTGCISDGTCEIMKNEDALAIIDDILKTGSGKKDEYNHERMDMKKIHQKYPYMIHEQITEDAGGKENKKYFDKLGAKSDLIYVALGQLVERVEALEVK